MGQSLRPHSEGHPSDSEKDAPPREIGHLSRAKDPHIVGVRRALGRGIVHPITNFVVSFEPLASLPWPEHVKRKEVIAVRLNHGG